MVNSKSRVLILIIAYVILCLRIVYFLNNAGPRIISDEYSHVLYVKEIYKNNMGVILKPEEVLRNHSKRNQWVVHPPLYHWILAITCNDLICNNLKETEQGSEEIFSNTYELRIL